MLPIVNNLLFKKASYEIFNRIYSEISPWLMRENNFFSSFKMTFISFLSKSRSVKIFIRQNFLLGLFPSIKKKKYNQIELVFK